MGNTLMSALQPGVSLEPAVRPPVDNHGRNFGRRGGYRGDGNRYRGDGNRYRSDRSGNHWNGESRGHRSSKKSSQRGSRLQSGSRESLKRWETWGMDGKQ